MKRSDFNFKSSGIQPTDRRFTPKRNKIERPVGIKTPLQLGDDILKMHTNPIRQISDNFRNLIMTNHGERLGLYDFGANLTSLIFDYINAPNFEQLAGEAIIENAAKYIPSVTVTNVQVLSIGKSEKQVANSVGTAKTSFRVEFLIPKFNSPQLAIEVDIVT